MTAHASLGCRGVPSHQVVPYCFGDLTHTERDAFERHLLSCSACWTEVERLESSVRALRTERRLAAALLKPDVLAVLGMSGRFERPFAGHAAFAGLMAALHAVLYAVPVLVEVAYQFDRFGREALRIAPLAFVWIMAATLLTLWVAVRYTRASGRGLAYAVGTLLAATVLLCAVLVPWFPTYATVDANFQTYTARASYFKSVVYAWLVFLPFVLWPFHFIIVCQRELTQGRHAALVALFSDRKPTITPRGTLFPRFIGLALYLALLGGISYVGVNHMFENLRPSPHMNLFMWLVMTRVVTWLALASVALTWYAMTLNELKRESIALASIAADPGWRSGLAIRTRAQTESRQRQSPRKNRGD